MIEIIRTDSSNIDFQNLVKLLDADLKIRDGEDHSFYSQFNQITHLNNVIVAYKNNVALACGAFKKYSENTVEIKRMFVLENQRGQGFAQQVLNELEIWAKELHFKFTVLETGKKQIEALNLYKKAGYKTISNYGQYENIENSICMKKEIN